MKVLFLSVFLAILSPLFAENKTCPGGEKPIKIELAWGTKIKCPDGSTPQKIRPEQQEKSKKLVDQKPKKNPDIQEAKNHHERLLTMMLKSTFRAPQWEKYLTDSGIDHKGCKQDRSKKEFIKFLYEDDLKKLNVGFRESPPGSDNCILSSHTFQLAKESFFVVPNVPSICLLEIDEDQRTPYIYVEGGEGAVGSKDKTGCLLKIKKHEKKAIATVNLINLKVKTKEGVKRYDGLYKLEYDKKENSVNEIELEYSQRE